MINHVYYNIACGSGLGIEENVEYKMQDLEFFWNFYINHPEEDLNSIKIQFNDSV